jgi:hypothetical protein
MQVYVYEYSDQQQNQVWNSLGSDKKLISLTPTGFKIHSRDGEVVTTMYRCIVLLMLTIIEKNIRT